MTGVCTALKFAHRVYKEAYEYRSPSVVALNANYNRKTARQEASEKKALLEHGISLKCQYILFDMSASKHSPPFVLFCIPEQRSIATQLRRRTRQSCQTSSLLLMNSLLNLPFCSNYIKSNKPLNYNCNKLKIHFPNSPRHWRVATKCVQVFAGSSFLQRMFRSCFMSVFKFTRVRVDVQKRFENGYVWTR